MKYFDKTFWKFTIGFLIVIFVSLVILYGTTSETFLRWLGQWRISRANEEISKIYSADIYGGETPQETFDMFLEALEAGDTEKASRFFVLDKQDEWLAKLNKMKNDGALAKQVENWKEARETFEEVRDEYNDWETHATVRYTFLVEKEVILTDKFGFKEKIKPGEYKGQIIFDLNKYSKVWKITLL